MLSKRSCSLPDFLRTLVTPASALARPPISNFQVAAAGATPSGDIYIGVNLEFPGVPLNQSVHAGQFLVANLRHHGESVLQYIAVNAAPCGHCRQFFTELACADDMHFLLPHVGPHGDESVVHQQISLEDLLPQRFGPKSLLGHAHPPLMLQPQGWRLRLTESSTKAAETHAGGARFGIAVRELLSCAQESYAPYTRCPSAVALISKSGHVFCGSYLESAAYNPGLQPMQAALVSLVMAGVQSYTDIEEVVLLEREGVPVQQRPACEVLLHAIAPGAKWNRLHCDIDSEAAR